MPTKKIPISFNEEDQRDIKELIKYLGIVGIYGDCPQAVKFGIKLALSTIKNPEKVYHGLKPSEKEQYFKGVLIYENFMMAAKSTSDAQKHAERYNPKLS